MKIYPTFCTLFFLYAFLSPAPAQGLFDSDTVLSLTLSGPVGAVLRDRAGAPKKHAFTLSAAAPGNGESALPVELSTRGHFRREKSNCKYPPLLIRFPKDGPHRASSVFREQHKMKLVMPCEGDEYLVREWLAYKMYNLVTPQSFRARLVRVALKDDKNPKEIEPFYGILLEEEKQLAKRNRMITVKRKLRPKQIQPDVFLRMAVFQYLIGNTDWSIQYQQNIKLMAADSSRMPIAVPYDFDHSGFVSAPYARPPEELKMRSVRERRYRGYCLSDMTLFEPVLAQYQQLKNDLYGLVTGCAFLSAKDVKTLTQFLDGFYETISDSKAWKKEFAYPCDPNGTGNVVIKGLKEE